MFQSPAIDVSELILLTYYMCMIFHTYSTYDITHILHISKIDLDVNTVDNDNNGDTEYFADLNESCLENAREISEKYLQRFINSKTRISKLTVL